MESFNQHNHRIEIVCHKGANNLAPENTYAAALQAIEWGADYIEVDVWTTRDGEMVVLHDPTVDRTTNGTGHIMALTLTEVRALDAGQWFAPRFAGERIPVLREYLQWLKDKVRVFLDVKFAHPQQLLDLIDEVGIREECFIWSASDEWMGLMHQLDPTVALKVNVTSPKDVLAAQKALGTRIVEVSLDRVSEELMAICRTRGIRLMIFEKEPEHFPEIIAWQPDMVNLDHIDRFQMALAGGHVPSAADRAEGRN